MSSFSPFFAKRSEFEDALARGHSLSARFGLPIVSEAPVYDLYEIRPRDGATAFVNRIAPTSELDGRVVKPGGADQYLIPNRGQFTEAVRIGSLGNDLALHNEFVVGRGLGAPIAALSEPETARGARANRIRGAAALGVAATVYDGVQTASTANAQLAQNNPLAAQSTVEHFAARGVGGWLGGALAGAAVGWETGPFVALFVAAGAYGGSEIGESAMRRWDERRIFNQSDGAGQNWTFTGNQWVRDLQGDLSDNRIRDPLSQPFAASPNLERQLNYQASNRANAYAMGDVERPLDPYSLPIDRSDAAYVQSTPWMRDPDTLQWQRKVVTVYAERGLSVEETIPAPPARAAQLDGLSSQIIAANIANGPAPIAARYEMAFNRSGWANLGGMPDAVVSALSGAQLMASNGTVYNRDARGEWISAEAGASDGPARGSVRAELEATRERLLPMVQHHDGVMASIPPWTPPTPEQQDRTALVRTYHLNGIVPTPENFEAIYQAVRETRERNGLEVAATSLSLQPDPNGGSGIDSPIAHLRYDSAGVIGIAAITSTEEIQRALAEVRTRDPSPLPVPGVGPIAPAPRGPDEPASAAQPRAPREDASTAVAAPTETSVAPVAVATPASAQTPRPQVDSTIAAPADPVSPIMENPVIGRAPRDARDPRDPDHPKHAEFETIRSALQADGRWNAQQTLNISADLLNRFDGDALGRRLDRAVVGDALPDGRVNAFAVYQPWGPNRESFHVASETGRSAQIPAEASFAQMQERQQTQLAQAQPTLEASREESQGRSGRSV